MDPLGLDGCHTFAFLTGVITLDPIAGGFADIVCQAVRDRDKDNLADFIRRNTECPIFGGLNEKGGKKEPAPQPTININININFK